MARKHPTITEVAHRMHRALEELLGEASPRAARPWASRPGPYNGMTLKPYRGFNSLLLSLAAAELEASGYPVSAAWVTPRQAELGAIALLRDAPPAVALLYKRTEPSPRSSGHVQLTFVLHNVSPRANPIPRASDPFADVRPSDYIAATRARFELLGSTTPHYSPLSDAIVVPRSFLHRPEEQHLGSTLTLLAEWADAPQRAPRPLPAYLREHLHAASMLSYELAASALTRRFRLAPPPLALPYVPAWMRLLEAHPEAIAPIASHAQGIVDFLDQQQSDAAVPRLRPHEPRLAGHGASGA